MFQHVWKKGRDKLKETLLHSIKEEDTLWTHHRKWQQPRVFCGAQRSKTDVDQAERVRRRLKVKYKHFPVEPIWVFFYFVILLQKLNPSYHTQSTHDPLATAKTNIYTFPLCLPPPIHRCGGSSNSNNPFTPSTSFHLFLSAMHYKQRKKNKLGCDNQFGQINREKMFFQSAKREPLQAVLFFPLIDKHQLLKIKVDIRKYKKTKHCSE